MIKRARRALVICLIAGSIAGCVSAAEQRDPRVGATDDRCYELGWERCPIEPYPYRTPLPPVEKTPLDGVYTRTITERLAWAPGKCRRCPPYRLLEGEEILRFDSGRFFVFHPDDGFRSSGHAEVTRGRVRLYNDANCIGVNGIYEWRLHGDLLRFEVVKDPCPYTGLRRRYLLALPWARRADVTDERCMPPTEEAATTGHWAIPPECLETRG